MKCPKCKRKMVRQEKALGSRELVWWCMSCGIRKEVRE